MNKTADKQKEIRKIDVESIEIRATNDNNYIIEGYINKFNTRSQYMGFYEEVDSHAFDNTLSDGHNIFGLYNHDYDKILGSTRTGSLNLSIDDIGLRFSLSINPNVSYAKDVYELVKSGEAEGCSFGFIALDDSWSILDDGTELRTLTNMHLIEATITPMPAYLSSEVSCRSYDQFKVQKEEEQRNLDKMKEKNDLEKELEKRSILLQLDLMLMAADDDEPDGDENEPDGNEGTMTMM